MAAADRLELVVVRHGLTAWNRERRYQGQRDIPLLLPEARPDLDRLRDHLAAERFDAIHCSDLTRCRQTLAHVLEGRGGEVETRFDARLRELDFGDYEGKCYAELKELAAYREWIDSRGERAPPNGESAAALRERLAAWLGELLVAAEAGGHRRVLTLTHGGVIRELRRRFEAIDFWAGSVGQAQGRRFVFVHQEGGWRCSSSSAVPAPASATR
ncbi:histidine phosphatase family protein [Halomonas kalidii]|uniref:Histidine phosphatase family protein n=1 Tax=Halomonas kalidii TaxID=3043293 RepID=A0ABT6VPY1_9GAMM|nr:histidine phosphatase family protein [Halomonas kalidii]MDI5936044.1 histidine phosphatase family protein [Halomonas kalidii]